MSYSKRSMNSNDSDDDDYNINNISNRAIRSNSKTNSLQQINSNNSNGNKNYRNKNRTDSEEEDDNNSNSYQRTTNYRRKINRNYDDEDDDDDNEENYQPRHSRQGSFRKPTNERSSSFVPRHIEQDDQRHYQKQQRNGSQTDNSWVNGRRTDELRNSDENGKAWTQAKSRSSTRRPQNNDDEDDDDDDEYNRNNYGRRSKVNRQQNDFDIENSYEETGTSRTRQVKPPRGERSYRNNNDDNDNNDDDNYNYHNSRSVNRNDRDNQSRSGSNSSRRQQNRSDYNNGDQDDDNYNNNDNNYNNNNYNNNNYNNNNRSKSGNNYQNHNNNNNNNNELVRRDERQAHLGRSNDTDEEDMLSDDGADIIKQEHDLKDRDMNDGVMRLGSNIPLVLLCPPNGGSTDLVECLILRDRSGVTSSLYPTYKLYLERNMKLLLIAQKMNLNTTSNYHLFDLSRGTVGGSLSKKSGNYLGKLRALDTNRTEYAVVTRSEEREEVAGILFERISIVNQLKEGCQPRKMTVLLPNLNAESEPIPHQVNSSKNGKKSLVDMIKNSENGRMFLLKSKEPVFENGNYRLNFHGRVSVPSVKNFQLSSPDDPTHVVCQFGKIGEDRFHLDYKAPLNAFQAFGLALCHFDT